MAEHSTSAPRVHMSFQVRRVGKSRGRSIVHFHGDASSEIGGKSALYDPNPRDLVGGTLSDLDANTKLPSEGSEVSFKSLCFRISTQTKMPTLTSGAWFGSPVSQVQSMKVLRITPKQKVKHRPSERTVNLSISNLERIQNLQDTKLSSQSHSIQEYESAEALLANSHSETNLRTSKYQKSPALNLRFMRFLASGSFASVHLAYDQQIKKKVAVKIFEKKEETQAKDIRAKVSKEVRMLKYSQSRDVVAFHRVVEDQKKIYLVLEYSDDWTTFQSYLKSQPFNRLDESGLRKFAKRLLTAVYHLHAGDVAHYDLKPQNILVDSQANLKIIDFGSADFISKPEVLGVPLGSKTYMAPELKFGRIAHINGAKADVWSIGRIIQIAYFGSQINFAEDEDYGIDTLENFLARCLTINVSARASLKDLLQHPWLQVSKL